MAKTVKELIMHLPQVGCVEWLGLRPARGVPMLAVDSVELQVGKGLVGDRFKGHVSSARQVTLLQFEHLQVIAACLHGESILPELLRRNVVVSGINLLALKDKRFQIGEAVLQFRGLCHPCRKMEKILGEGGYNAMRGHGGIVASVCLAGVIKLKDRVTSLPELE